MSLRQTTIFNQINKRNDEIMQNKKKILDEYVLISLLNQRLEHLV